ncbi:MAG TPA: ABC transporter ATP-binding protein [Candidatus Binatia bacterium]|nr:ABC transporter ATP-binding protein [Candidatus Binatia bacterium]
MSGAAGTAFDAGTRGAAASERADERSAGAAGDPLLDVRDLAVAFETPRGTVRAVDGVSFAIARGATLGLVGESGSGKSVTSLAILRLLDESARILRGEVWLEGRNLLELPESELREVRGGRIAMIFQEPSTSLDPVFTVGSQIVEAIRLHRPVGRRAAWAEAVEALRMVEIPDPERRVRSYPHELSGGMKQRVMIAIALSCRPALLIADEPTTALDVTIQAQVLALLRDLKQRLGMSMMLITHDLGVVANEADEVAILYAGRIVERAPVRELFRAPAHPYTAALLQSLPRLRERRSRLVAIPGVVPDPARLPSGCRFRDRCPIARERCAAEDPVLRPIAADRLVACHFPAVEPAPGAPARLEDAR